MNIQMIPLNKLVRSRSNVRKTGAEVGIEELAASIAAHGLLQNLQVCPGAKNKFEVVAGGRRLTALKLLARRKAIDAKAEIACEVRDAADAVEVSLAENAVRVQMHPADQYEAFRALAETGKGPEDIAARFGVTANTVRQRLKLAAVSPRLLEAYRAEEMSLDQLMAFAVSDDITAQEKAWFDNPHSRSPYCIRRILTQAQVETGDDRVQFVGLDAYEAAGGGVFRDLFQPEHEGYLTDVALLERLVTERLAAEAAAIEAEGWKWVEVAPRLDHAALKDFGRVHPERVPLSDDRQAELDRLTAKYEGMLEELGDDPEPHVAEQLECLSEEIDALSSGDLLWKPEEMGFAGAILTITYGGALRIERGLVRPEDSKSIAAAQAESGTDGAQQNAAMVETGPMLSASLVEDLTAHRTAALRQLLARNHHVALAALAHALAMPLFHGRSYDTESCLSIRVTSRDLVRSAETVGASFADGALATVESSWRTRLPERADDLFAWLLAQEDAVLVELLAFCAGSSVDAVRTKQDRPDCPRLMHANHVAAALGLDMSQWWHPTGPTYLGRVPKRLVLEAVAEAVSPQAAENLAGLRKDALITVAEERLAGTGWLPAILRETHPPMNDAGHHDAAA